MEKKKGTPASIIRFIRTVNSDLHLHSGKQKNVPAAPYSDKEAYACHGSRMLGKRTYLNMTLNNVVFECVSEYLMVVRACSPPFCTGNVPKITFHTPVKPTNA